MKNFKNAMKVFTAGALGLVMLFAVTLSACEPTNLNTSNPNTPTDPIEDTTPWEDWAGTDPVPVSLDYKEVTIGSPVVYDGTSVTLTADKTGVYRVGFKSSAESEILTIEIRNSKYPNMCTTNAANTADVDEDGYLNYVYYVYLEKGENTVIIKSLAETTFDSMRYALVKETASLSYFGTEPNFRPLWGPSYAMWRLVQEDLSPITLESTMVIEEDGFYDFSLFASSVNYSDVCLTLTDEDGFSTSFYSPWLDKLTSVQHFNNYDFVWYADTFYRERECPLDHFDFQSTSAMFMTAGTYNVAVTAMKYQQWSQVLFGGGVFASKSETTCTHDYEKTGTRAASCDLAGGDVMTCKGCGHQKLGNRAEALGHNFGSDPDNKFCSRCGYMEINMKNKQATIREPFIVPVTAAKTGVYLVSFKINSTYNGDNVSVDLRNEKYPNMSTNNCLNIHQLAADGYIDYVLYAYLEQGANNIKINTSGAGIEVGTFAAEFSAMRCVLVTETAAAATFSDACPNFEAWEKPGFPMFQLTQLDQGPMTFTSTITIAEDGVYRFSAFAAGVNLAVMNITLSRDDFSVTINAMEDDFERLRYTQKLADESHIWYVQELHPNLDDSGYDRLVNPNISLKAGTYTVSATASNTDYPWGQVEFGGGLFAEKVG